MEFENLSLAEIVTARPAAATLFENMSLDFCCKGKQKLNEALLNDQSKLVEVKSKLEKIFSTEDHSLPDFTVVSLSQLIDHILETHHRYVKEVMPVIQQHLEKVVTKHGDLYPHMHMILDIFNEVKVEFENHMKKEELILFPNIRRIESDQDLSTSISLQSIIDVMENEHSEAGQMMEKIKELSNNYTAPENTCITFRICMEELRMFEIDLHKHVHLENNILFPRAIDLQKSKINISGSCGIRSN